MDEHFADLFGRYEALAPQHVVQPAWADLAISDASGELALARAGIIAS
jgi:hypothetical protein